MSGLIQRASFAIQRPDMLWRKLRRRDLIQIGLHEVGPYFNKSPIILEAGSCDGEDTVKFAAYWPGATIYAFEPLPELFAETERRTRHLQQVHRYPMALADQTSSATLYVSADQDGVRGSSSLLPPDGHLDEYPDIAFDRVAKVPTVTIADWASKEGVERIDFMWLDMQGMELPALKAAGPVLATTRAICMEVSRKELYAGCALYEEVMLWMEGRGFRPAIDRVTLTSGNILFVRGQF